MNSKRVRNTVAAMSVAIIVSGCGATAPKISESDILSAERNGTLQSLYTQVRDGKGLGQSLKPADKTLYLEKIGTRLANQAAQQISAMLNNSRLGSNQVPLAVLSEQNRAAQAIQAWDGSVFHSISNTLSSEKSATQKAIDLKQAVFDSIDSQNISKKFPYIAELKALYGGGNSQMVEQMAEQLLSDNYDLVNQLVSNQDYDRAIAQLKQVVAVAPSYKDVESKLADLEKTALQNSFISYVHNGETDKAHELLNLIAKGKYFAQQKSAITPAALELANYYVAMGVEATSEENLTDAYRMFTQGRRVKSLFGLQTEEVTQESDFIDFVYALYEESYNKKSYGLALGYLMVIDELRPQFPELETYKRLTTDNVMDRAVKRVSTTAFSGDQQTSSLGRSISSKITQYVFDTLPQDVRVVEREQLNAVLREQEISALKQGSGVQLDSADLLIQGTILESNVETNRNDSSKKMRVVTERIEQTNPAYTAWLQLSSSKQEKTPQPPKTRIKEVKEDISIKVTYERKVAVLSISYRVVDAKSARVLYADSVSDKKKVADETTEGVELGEFKAPFKMAELPSDSELLSDLTVTLAQRIGTKVVELLKDPEVGYQAAGNTLYDERNFVDATEEVAKALVMTQSKSKDDSKLMQLIREYSMAARLEN